MKFWKWTIGIIILVVVLYFSVIPIVWTLTVSGKIGLTEHGSMMVIESVVPWPSKELWCYQGVWLLPGELPRGLGDDGTIDAESKQPGFRGYSYVWEMDIQ
jgi:hypothetical protein